MNILCAGHYYNVKGGSDRYMVELVDLLGNKGNKTLPFCVKDDGNLASEYSKYWPAGVSTSTPSDYIRYIYSSEVRRCLADLLDQNKVDMAHLHIYYGQLTSSILRELSEREIPIVQTLHEYKLTCPIYTHLSGSSVCTKCANGSRVNLLLNRCKDGSILKSSLVLAESVISRQMGDVKLVDHFIAPSQFLHDLMVSSNTIPVDKISRVPYHIDTVKYTDSSSVSGSYVLYFGRLAQVKGLETLIRAVAGTNIRLVVAGTGPLEKKLAHTIASSTDYNNIELVGFKTGNDLRRLVENCSFTVLPSEWFDNFPLAIMESMALGKPVVGSAIGGIPEMIEHGVDGYTFTPGNHEELRDLMLSLYSNQALQLEMGKNARRRAEKDYCPDLHYEQLSEIYSKLRVEAVSV